MLGREANRIGPKIRKNIYFIRMKNIPTKFREWQGYHWTNKADTKPRRPNCPQNIESFTGRFG